PGFYEGKRVVISHGLKQVEFLRQEEVAAREFRVAGHAVLNGKMYVPLYRSRANEHWSLDLFVNMLDTARRMKNSLQQETLLRLLRSKCRDYDATSEGQFQYVKEVMPECARGEEILAVVHWDKTQIALTKAGWHELPRNGQRP